MPKDTDPKTIHPAELFHSNRDGTFTEVARPRRASTVVGFVKGVASGDYDNDGRPDLYVSLAERGQPAAPQRRPAPGRPADLALHATSPPRPACSSRT